MLTVLWSTVDTNVFEIKYHFSPTTERLLLYENEYTLKTMADTMGQSRAEHRVKRWLPPVRCLTAE